jgi:hypothetical protein
MPADAVENTVFYVQRGGKRLREISYKLTADGFTSTDTSLLAEHLFDARVQEWVVQRGSSSRLWVLMKDHTVAVLTSNVEQQVTAWQRVSTANRKILHIAVLPGKAGKDDEVWMVVDRSEITCPYLERMCSDLPHLDSCVEFVSTWSGQVPNIIHLTEYPTHVVDKELGIRVQPKNVKKGRSYYLGIPIVGELQTLPMEGNMSFNSVRQFSRFKVRLLMSDTAFEYRSTANSRWEQADAVTTSEMTLPYTGALRLPQMPDSSVGQALCIRYSGSNDFRLLSITQEVDYHGK